MKKIINLEDPDEKIKNSEERKRREHYLKKWFESERMEVVRF
jgi:hypothetical protein